MQTSKKLTTALLILLSCSAYSQNVGIGVPAPTEALSVSRGLNIDHNNESNGTTLLNGLRFGNTAFVNQIVGISGNVVGVTVPNSLYSLGFYTSNTRRMVITQNGFVGIGMIPSTYMLEVAGTIHSGFNIRADGDLYSNDVNAADDVTAVNDITATNGNITATSGNITATNGDISAPNGVLKAGGDGVIMNNGSSRMKLVTYTISFNSGGAGMVSEQTATGVLNISTAAFTSAPTVYLGNAIVENGESYKVTLTFENVTTTAVTCRITNLCPSTINFTGASWKVMVIGPY
jgi:hypothetical protein